MGEKQKSKKQLYIARGGEGNYGIFGKDGGGMNFRPKYRPSWLY